MTVQLNIELLGRAPEPQQDIQEAPGGPNGDADSPWIIRPAQNAVLVVFQDPDGDLEITMASGCNGNDAKRARRKLIRKYGERGERIPENTWALGRLQP